MSTNGMPGRFWRQAGIKRIALDASVSTLATGISALLGIARAALIARGLGVENFGRWSVAFATTTLVRQLLSLRVWEWLAVNASRASAQGDRARLAAFVRTAYAIELIVAIFSLVLLELAAGQLATRLLRDGSVALIIRILAVQNLFDWLDQPSQALLRTQGRFKWLAGYNVAGAVARTLAIALPASRGSLFWTTVAIVASQALLSVGLGLRTLHELRERLREVPNRISLVLAEWRDHLRTLLTLSLTDTVKTLSANLDGLLIAHFTSVSDAGAYRASHNVVNGLQQLSTPLYMVLHTEIAKAIPRRDLSLVRNIVHRVTWAIGVATATMCLLLTVLSAVIIRSIYGERFHNAAGYLAVMNWSLVVLAVQWANPVFVSISKPRWTLWMVTAGLAVKVTSMFALLSLIGGTGAAVAYALHGLGVVVVALVLLRPALRLLESGATQSKGES